MSEVFRQKKRSAGILMPVFSLPSEEGIGTMGEEACRFLDRLKQAGIRYWQILPLGHAGDGSSPYSCISSFAGNPLLIDLGLLVKEGLLEERELKDINFGRDPEHIDYGQLEMVKYPLLRLAAERGKGLEKEQQLAFEEENKSWLYPYALYLAERERHPGKSWNRWETKASDLLGRGELPEECRFWIYVQYLFFKQWNRLRAYAKELGILIIGDLPVYVPFDSADVWSEPEQFRLTENQEPAFVSGVPPDAFSETGQRWGNPIFNYEKMAADGYGWWIRRVGGAGKMYDVIRIDHFRGFASYYSIPSSEPDARKGTWEKGPGMDLVGRLTSWFSGTDFIAEDLGLITEDVYLLLKESGLPGMRVLEFAFEPGADSSHLPHHYEKNTVCYTGTHDNAPLKLWEKETGKKETEFARNYLGISRRADLSGALIREAYASVSFLAVIPMQDWLGLGEGARTNVPGVPEGNWTWRMEKDGFTNALSEKIRSLGELYGRQEG